MKRRPDTKDEATERTPDEFRTLRSLDEIMAGWPEAQRPVARQGAIEAIKKRLEEKRQEYESFRAQIPLRLREEDAHGGWDAFVCMSEVSSYIDGLEFALRALGGR